MSGWGLLVGELGDGNQREQMEWNICSVLLQMYSKVGITLPVPGNNSFVWRRTHTARRHHNNCERERCVVARKPVKFCLPCKSVAKHCIYSIPYDHADGNSALMNGSPRENGCLH